MTLGNWVTLGKWVTLGYLVTLGYFFFKQFNTILWKGHKTTRQNQKESFTIIIIITIRSLLLRGATELLALGCRPFYVACKM